MDPSKKLEIFSLLVGIIYACTEAASADSTLQPDLLQNVQNAVHKVNAQFSTAILKETKPEGNFLFSPINVYAALALLHLGATGTTKNELSTILGISSDEDKQTETHEAIGKIINDLQNTSNAKVAVANGVFPQKGLKIKDSYLENSNKYYKSEVQSVDFAKGGNEATDFVNKWISSKTKDRIPKLFQDEISTDTRLLLASALYFSAKWQNTFSNYSTQLEKFNTGLKEVDVPTMNKQSRVPYVNDEAKKFEAIALPYEGKDFYLVIVLPYANQTLKALVDELQPENYQKLVQDISPKFATTKYVHYKIPRLKFKWSQSINQRIIEAGAKSIFQNAEIANIFTEGRYAVSDVTHAAEIEVNEEGTTATAVTVIQFVRASLQINLEEPVKFFVNRPFLFSILSSTGISLFTGLVQNPAEGA